MIDLVDLLALAMIWLMLGALVNLIIRPRPR